MADNEKMRRAPERVETGFAWGRHGHSTLSLYCQWCGEKVQDHAPECPYGIATEALEEGDDE